MKTISTKVDQALFDKLLDTCNTEGCSVSEKLRGLVQNCVSCSSSKNMSKPDSTDPRNSNIEQTDNHEGKVPVLRFHWEGDRLVQDETIWRDKDIPKAKIVKILK